jgi:glycosyltransferase involved in cell wall biosynthesis
LIAGSQRDAESRWLKVELERHQIRVLDEHLPNIEELYRLADCYVFTPTSTDHALAMPLSVLEAMACNLPVVSTPFGALSERFVDVPGLRLVTGALQLLVAVDELLKKRPPTRHIAESYSWDDVAQQLVGIIESRGLMLIAPT